MLILVLFDVQCLQNVVFCFEKGWNDQNPSCSGSHRPIKKFLPAKLLIPPPTPQCYLENPAPPILTKDCNCAKFLLVQLSQLDIQGHLLPECSFTHFSVQYGCLSFEEAVVFHYCTQL